MQLTEQAQRRPEHPAIIMGASGRVVTYHQLDDTSARLAHTLHDRGLRHGDCIAILMDNNVHYHAVAWAAQRSGLYYTTINTHLGRDEIEYVLRDCGAKAVIASHAVAELATSLRPDRFPRAEFRLMVEGIAEGWTSFEDALVRDRSASPPTDTEGEMMIYSSGTTGRPKGIKRAITSDGAVMKRTAHFLRDKLAFTAEDIYLSPAPLFHTAPLSWSMGVHRLGGTVVVMERFDAREALRLIEKHQVTHSQWVPTMFNRMLRLPDRDRFDLSSHRFAVHAAAPCPPPVKQRMLDWWGPILHEYYSSTEAAGMTWISPQQWQEHPGSVGTPLLGELHILDDEGGELPSGQVGEVCFGDIVPFEYHQDPVKTAGSRRGDLVTVGDLGYVDDDGYLYLTDRRSNMVISGGVNIFPQQAENLLIAHPAVADAAVFGIPDSDLGEVLQGVVQPVDASAGPELATELVAHCREQLGTYRSPRAVDFTDELPRQANGKLYKSTLREKYRSR